MSDIGYGMAYAFAFTIAAAMVVSAILTSIIWWLFT